MLTLFDRALLLGLVCFFVCCGSDGKKERQDKPRKPMPVPRPVPSPDVPDKEVPREPDEGPEEEVNYCVRGGARLDKRGPYLVRHRFYGRLSIIAPITQDNCKMPIFNFSNGTGASNATYYEVSKRMASHGYYSVSYNTPNSGNGRQNLEAVIFGMGRDNVAYDKVCLNGHSQGSQGVASLTYLLEDMFPDIHIAAVYSQPAWGMNNENWMNQLPKIKSDGFVISGSRDYIVKREWVQAGWDLLSSRKYWYEAQGATHLNANGWFASGGLGFCNMALFDHEDARKFFFEDMPNSSYWKVIYD